MHTYQSRLASNSTTARASNARIVGTISKLLSALALVSLGAGCSAAMGEEDGEFISDAGGEEAVRSTEEALTSNFFRQYTFTSSNGSSFPERFADCPIDTILTGIGARVNNDNLTDLTIFCSRISASGTLEIDSDVVQVGGPSKEVEFHAIPNFVIVAAGGVVSNDNVRRIVIRQCQWNPATRRVNTGTCVDRGSDGNASAELTWSAHQGLSTLDAAANVATGFGFTVSNDNVRVVALRRGTLF